MRENRIEKRLRVLIERAGGQALKWESPGCVGVPDRIVLLPGGRITFVELKAPGRKPKPIQEYRIGQLEALGFSVEVLDSLEAVEDFVKRKEVMPL